MIRLEDRMVERIARDLLPRLARGSVVVPVDEIDNVERWRKGARRAGRLLGQSVRTMVSSDGTTVFAFLNRKVERGDQAKAANLVASLIFGSGPTRTGR